MSENTDDKKNILKEEFLLSITFEEAMRIKEDENADYVTGVRIDTGERINVRMLEPDELYDYGLNKLKRDGEATRKRPSLRDLMNRPAMTKFLNLTNMMKQQGVDPATQGVPAFMTLKINTAVKTGPDFYGTRWINIMNGAGAMGMAKDAFFAVSGLEGDGRLFSVARPITRKNSDQPPTVFTSIAFTKQAEIDQGISFLEDAKGMQTAMETAAQLCSNVGGGNPLVKIVALDENDQPVSAEVHRTVFVDRKLNNVTENETEFLISSSYKGEDGKYVHMTPEEAVKHFISSEEGSALNSAIADKNVRFVAVPVCQMMYGRDAALKMANEISDKHRDFFYSNFEKEVDGMLGKQQAFNEGFVCIRQGDWKKLVFITESFPRLPNNPPVRISDIAADIAKQKNVLAHDNQPATPRPSM